MDLTKLADPENLVLPVISGAIVQAIRASAGDWLRTPRGRRLVPLLPYLVAISAALAGLGTAGPWRERLILGILAGAISGSAYDVFRSTVVGKANEAKELAKPPTATRQETK